MIENKRRKFRFLAALALSLALLIISSMPVLAESGGDGDTRTIIAPASAGTEDEGVDAIAITVIIPPAPERPAPVQETRRLFPVNVAEGYNYEGVRELVRIYELLPGESPEWINTDSFQRNGYYYQLADITRRVDIAHTIREHTEIIEIHTERNDLAAVIAGLYSTMDFTDEDGYVGVLHLNIHSIEMTQAGTRTTSRTVSQVREFPHLSNPDIALLPQTVTAGGRTYTLADVNWQTNTATPIDFNSVAQTFTAHATYTRTATSTVSTGYTTIAEYSGTLTRVSTGDTRFVARFFGTPIISPTVNRPTATPSPSPEQGQAANGGGNGGNGYNGANGTNGEQAEVPTDPPMCEATGGDYEYNHKDYNGNGYPNAGETTTPPTDNEENGDNEGGGFSFLSLLPLLLLLLLMAGGVLALVFMMLKFKKKADTLQNQVYKDSGDALHSRMASIIKKDRREIAADAEHDGEHSVEDYLDDALDFEDVAVDEDESEDDMGWLDEELSPEISTDSEDENT